MVYRFPEPIVPPLAAGRSCTADASLFRAVFFGPKPFFNQQLNPSRWPQFCDHSVTSADVRLSVGPNLSRAACQRPVDLRQSQAWTGGPSERKFTLLTILLLNIGRFFTSSQNRWRR